MGSRGRSIRLRIYFLVAIPLVAMIGLLAYVAGTSVNNAINLDRAPDLINATSLPTANFIRFVQDERAAAVIYLFKPTQANLTAYQAAVKATDGDEPAFLAAMESPGTKRSETPAEAQGIAAVIAGLSPMKTLREGVENRALSPLTALQDYSGGILNEPRLFLDEADSLTNATAASQALGLIATVSAHEALSQEYALLSGMLAAHRESQADRAALAAMAATRQADVIDANYVLDAGNLAIFNKQVNTAFQNDVTDVEEAVSAGISITKLPITVIQWQELSGQVLGEYFTGGVNVANAQLAADRQISRTAWTRVAVTGGIGLLGLLVTIAVTFLVARGIIRRLRGLERNALQLAEVQLPDVVGRLRRGENVDVAAEAPPMRTGTAGLGTDEIGRVGTAFELVRQTAIRAAVEEARLRQGLNDVFRSLARRSQSLLHRQLTLLDQMERRATDPEALDDLFRLDHLTTRMRRHAEGLVILAGAPPGRTWSSPVRMVDVMRGAIAEVEDYARVSVATRSQAALAGSAVADVIHLLAELIENATTLSPPYTSVRVSGDTVASGFAIEVEDRGLGMSAPRLAELNERLASPPEFNPSDSEQLGLFVVSQLAKRHGIRVTLKASPYGGTAAIVLIPQHLVVTEEAFRAGLPGEPAAIGPASAGPASAGPASAGRAAPGTNGNHGPAEMTRPARLAGTAELGAAEPSGRGQGLPDVPGVRISGPLRRSPGGTPEGDRRGAHHAAPRGARSPGLEPAAGLEAGAGLAAGAGWGRGEAAANRAGEHPDFDVFTPQRRVPGTGDAAVPAEQAEAAAFVSSPPYPGTAPYADQLAPFPGWTGRSVAGGSVTPEAPSGASPGGASGAAGPGAPGGPTTPMTPVASSRPAGPSRPPWELSRQTGPLPAIPADGEPGAQPDGDDDVKGLPRRVRQASIAPQLRDNPPRRRTSPASAPAPASGPTPAEIRQTMSALQRGWQEGRSQRMTASAPGDSPYEPPGQEPSADGAEPWGESDGT
ncbi:MAG TPA: nitrate- and nitrite sensing domain-containing protein [Streptosporangiaceae bacterium]|nr:nitrate- and nitrite sensing domain-containing protein [Streptosporangiaceae bacterium]